MKPRNSSTARLLPPAACLLPLLLSIAVYSRLPEQIAIHWNLAGEPDNFAPKAIAAFGLPFLFCIITIFVQAKLYSDPKRGNASQAMGVFSIWLAPVLSLIMVPMTLLIALGVDIPIPFLVILILGIIFVICGNYLPKSRQNYTIGIKLPWTLASTENWNKTHRLAGFLWVLGGFCIIATSFASFAGAGGGIHLSLVIIVVIVMIPTVYSYWLYRKEGADHEEE